MNADQLQEFSYQLCYLFSRCTRSVSIVPPVYYGNLSSLVRIYFSPNITIVLNLLFLIAAHLAAYRARLHMADMITKETDPKETNVSKDFPPWFVEVHKRLDCQLYYS